MNINDLSWKLWPRTGIRAEYSNQPVLLWQRMCDLLAILSSSVQSGVSTWDNDTTRITTNIGTIVVRLECQSLAQTFGHAVQLSCSEPEKCTRTGSLYTIDFGFHINRRKCEVFFCMLIYILLIVSRILVIAQCKLHREQSYQKYRPWM